MFVTLTASKAFKRALSFGCYAKLYPYKFDSEHSSLQRLKLPLHRKLHVFQKIIMYFITVFALLRFAQAMTNPYFPLLLKVLNVAWAAAYVLSSLGFLQFEYNEDQIRNFINCMMKSMDASAKIKFGLFENKNSLLTKNFLFMHLIIIR